jgi:hypothetical protein
MTLVARVIDDPDHPEGGHAWLFVAGLEARAAPTRIAFASLTDGFEYAGPREIAAEGLRDGDETKFALGPAVVGALPPGVAVLVALPDYDAEIEMRWPTLTPPRAAAKRRPVRQTAPRAVVEAVSTPKAPKLTPKSGTPESPDVPEIVETPKLIETPKEDASAKVEDEIDLKTEPARDEVKTAPEPKPLETLQQPPETKAQPRDVAPARARGIGWLAASLVWLVAFALGGGAGYFLPHPTSVTPVVAQTDTKAPSLFDTLAQLPDRSPKGSQAPSNDMRALLMKGEDATDDAERAFWRERAARTMLQTKDNGVARTLSELGSGLANAGAPVRDLTTARTLWELGAIADDCAAMDNIAMSLSAAPNAPPNPEADTWRERAKTCREHRRK